VKDLADLISAVASLLWPLLAIFVVFRLRHQLPNLLPRLRKASIAGQTFELDPEVRDLERRVAELTSEPVPEPPGKTLTTESSDPTADVVDRLLALAATDKKVSIIAIGVELERAIRNLAAQLGVENPYSAPLRNVLDQLIRRGSLPESARSSLDVFWQVRNRVVHAGPEPLGEADLTTIIDIGISLLRVVASVPHETYRVVDQVPVFRDPGATTPFTGITGIILEVAAPSGVKVEHRIYPTSRKYAKGALVGWAWNLSTVFEQAWYRETSGTVVQAWTSAGEFVGPVLN
jgi:hypothetical protein